MPALAGDLGTELKPGLTVKVVGLKNAPEHNGKRGKLVSFDAERGRWEVRMRSGKAMKIKSENLASDPVTGDTTTSRLERKVNKYAHHLGLVAVIAVSENTRTSSGVWESALVLKEGSWLSLGLSIRTPAEHTLWNSSPCVCRP